MRKLFFLTALTLVVPSFLQTNVRADLVNVVANSNTETITQVIMDVTAPNPMDGGLITQNAPDAGTSKPASSALLQTISLSSGTTLGTFNPITPTISNASFPTGSQIEVFTPNTAVGSTAANFLDELANVHSTGDLMQYLRVDGTQVEPEWDIRFGATFGPDDYLIVEERNGNTTFTVEPLDVAGNLITGSDTLSFDAPSYQWDIGYANALDPNNNQSQVMSVIDFDLFNTTTPIAGFRIVNTGRADFKFFIGTAVPEPTGGLLLMLMTAGISTRRKRRS